MKNTLYHSSFQTIAVVAMALTLGLGIGSVSAFTTAPGVPPTCPTTVDACNVPLHIGATSQTKGGNLGVTGYMTVGNNLLVSGSAGIGNISPTANLHVGSGASAGNTFILESSASKFRMRGAGGVLTMETGQNWTTGSVGGLSITGAGGSPSLLTIAQTSGNVGIGSSNPQAKLVVNDTSGTGVPAYFTSSGGGSTRVAINNISNAGFGLYTGGNANGTPGATLRWSVASYQQSGTNSRPDFSIWNDQIGQSAIFVDGDSNQVQIGAGGLYTPALRLANGTQGANKVLTSDAQGNATWAAPTGGASGAIVGGYMVINGSNDFNVDSTWPCNTNNSSGLVNRSSGTTPQCSCASGTTAAPIFSSTIGGNTYHVVACYRN